MMDCDYLNRLGTQCFRKSVSPPMRFQLQSKTAKITPIYLSVFKAQLLVVIPIVSKLFRPQLTIIFILGHLFPGWMLITCAHIIPVPEVRKAQRFDIRHLLNELEDPGPAPGCQADMPQCQMFDRCMLLEKLEDRFFRGRKACQRKGFQMWQANLLCNDRHDRSILPASIGYRPIEAKV